MRFTETPLSGAFVIDLEMMSDERGFFARSFCAREFEEHGLSPSVVQTNTSYNAKAGTLRGMHYQNEVAPEPKLVRCVRGALYDVIVDMRPGSPTYAQHFGVELSAENRTMLYVPALFAHGFQTLVDDTEAIYQVGGHYTPDAERGLRFDDPALGIDWPRPVTNISDKDRSWPLLESGSEVSS